MVNEFGFTLAALQVSSLLGHLPGGTIANPIAYA